MCPNKTVLQRIMVLIHKKRGAKACFGTDLHIYSHMSGHNYDREKVSS